MTMNKEQEIIEKLLRYIQRADVEIGSSLPSERKLASMFSTSRNTLRNASRKLEARGLIEIRKGSGSYLLCKEDRFEAWQAIRTNHSAEDLHNLFEARYLFEPAIAALSAMKIDARHIDALERCLVRFSRGFIRKAKQSVANEDAEFRKIVADSTGNRVFVSLMAQFSSGNMAVFRYLDRLEDEIKDRLFADYVEIINALKNHDPASIKIRVARNILSQYQILRKHRAEDLPEINTDEESFTNHI